MRLHMVCGNMGIMLNTEKGVREGDEENSGWFGTDRKSSNLSSFVEDILSSNASGSTLQYFNMMELYPIIVEMLEMLWRKHCLIMDVKVWSLKLATFLTRRNSLGFSFGALSNKGCFVPL